MSAATPAPQEGSNPAMVSSMGGRPLALRLGTKAGRSKIPSGPAPLECTRVFLPRARVLFAERALSDSGESLGEQSANQCCVRHAADRQNVGAGAHVGQILARGFVDFAEGALHYRFELGVHFRFGPKQALHILNPLEVAGGYPAGVGQDVREQGDSLAREYFVG